jgi:hypothetical protein
MEDGRALALRQLNLEPDLLMVAPDQASIRRSSGRPVG